MVKLVQSGRTPDQLAQEYEPSARTIRDWVAPPERNAGERAGGLRSDERWELRPVQRENTQLQIEPDILRKQRLVRTGERLDPGARFEFVKAIQAVWPYDLPSAGLPADSQHVRPG